MKHGNIKSGQGANIVSPVYQEMGRIPKRSISRSKPVRGQRFEKKGRRSSR